MRARNSRPRRTATRRHAAAAAIGCSLLLVGGCSWDGLNSLPLPGTKGTSGDSYRLTAVVPNVGTLTQNSPVMIDDVTVGSIRKITADDEWNAQVEIGLDDGTDVPRGTEATVGQASLLGSQYLELTPPQGVAKDSDLLSDGDTIPLQSGGRYPSTEQTFSTLSVVLNGGGLAQLQDITTELNDAFGGNEESLHDLIPHLNELVTTLDEQKGNIVAAMDGVDRLGGTVSEQNDVLAGALEGLEPASEVLAENREELVDALLSLGEFSSVADRVLTEGGDDLRSVLHDAEPVIAALADSGDSLVENLTLLFTFPFPMETLFDAMQGDYTNLYDYVDLTNEGFEESLLFGGDLEGALGGTDWARSEDGPDGGADDGAGAAEPSSSDPFNPNVPEPDEDVEEPGAEVPDLDGLDGLLGGDSGDGLAGIGDGGPDDDRADLDANAPDTDVRPEFVAPDSALFGPPATGEGK